ncbi:unnamed protein product, partial [Laminaria digitata]
CPGEGAWEVDWYTLTPPEDAATLSIEVVGDGTPALRAALWAVPQSEDEPSLVRVANATPGEPLVLEALVEADTPLALRISSEDGVGRLESLPTYQIEYRYRQ